MEKIDNVVPPLDAQRAFFGCEGWEDEDLDTMIRLLKTYPGGDFVAHLGINAQRQYAMSCIWLKENYPDRYEYAIVRGKVWTGDGDGMSGYG